jgi:hypothetical protein
MEPENIISTDTTTKTTSFADITNKDFSNKDDMKEDIVKMLTSDYTDAPRA